MPKPKMKLSMFGVPYTVDPSLPPGMIRLVSDHQVATIDTVMGVISIVERYADRAYPTARNGDVLGPSQPAAADYGMMEPTPKAANPQTEQNEVQNG